MFWSEFPPLNYEVSSIVLVITLMLMLMPNFAENRRILSMSAAAWEICWSYSFWVQFSFVLGVVGRVLFVNL